MIELNMTVGLLLMFMQTQYDTGLYFDTFVMDFHNSTQEFECVVMDDEGWKDTFPPIKRYPMFEDVAIFNFMQYAEDYIEG